MPQHPDLYRCPVCHAPLRRDDRQWHCENRHSFDIARQGHVNLLLVQKKKSHDPGDNKAMVQARQAFLTAGHYLPVAKQVAQVLDNTLPATTADIRLLDVGCGEGYYSEIITRDLATQGRGNILLWGIDISKSAVQAAARRDPAQEFCVASSADLPFPDASFDGLIKIYAPARDEELLRVLKPGGVLVTVNPGPRHLYQLKAMVYDEVRLHAFETPAPPGFTGVHHEQLDFMLTLDHGDDIANLLAMTPFYWAARPETQQRITALPALDTEVSFLIEAYRKVAADTGTQP